MLEILDVTTVLQFIHVAEFTTRLLETLQGRRHGKVGYGYLRHWLGKLDFIVARLTQVWELKNLLPIRCYEQCRGTTVTPLPLSLNFDEYSNTFILPCH